MRNLLFIFSLIWLTVPEFGQVFLWRLGSANYTLTLFVAILFLLPYRFLIEKEEFRMNRVAQVIFVVLSVLAGWSNENLGIIILLISGLAVGYAKYKKKIVPTWAYVGILCTCVGWLFLILAPGNYYRLATTGAVPLYKESTSGALRYFSGTQLLLYVEYALITIFLLLLFIKKKGRVVFNIWLILYACSLLGVFAFCFSKLPSNRALASSSYFMIMATFGLYVIFAEHYKRTAMIILGGLLYLTAESVFLNADIFIRSQSIVEARNEIYSKSKGLAVTVPSYKYVNKYFFPADGDVSTNPKHWHNQLISKMYDLQSVVLEDECGTVKSVQHKVGSVDVLRDKIHVISRALMGIE